MSIKHNRACSGENAGRKPAGSVGLQALALALLLGTPVAVHAQDADAEAETESEEERQRLGGDIVVTATKVATNVQDTPIALTAVSAEALANSGLTTTADLGNVVPNASFRKAEGVYGPAVTIYLRGVGQGDPQLSGEPAVAFYIDDIYYPFLFGGQMDLLDLDHVEVLRGPQGTLFGRNAIAGAINMVSKKPSLNDATASIDVTVGANNRRDVRTSFSVPLTDNLAIGASFLSKKRDGYQRILDFTCQMHKNGTPELAGSFPFYGSSTAWTEGREPGSCVIDHLGGEDTRAVRGSLYWEPAHNISLSISGDYVDANDEQAAEAVIDTNYRLTYGLQADGTVNEAVANKNLITAFDRFSIPGTPFRWDERFETGDPFTTYDTFCDPIPAGTQIPGNTYYNGSLFKGGRCLPRNSLIRNRGIQGKLVVGITDRVDLTAIAGWRALDMGFTGSYDGTPLADAVIHHEIDEHHWTGELRLTGRFDFADLVGGLFYYEGEAEHLNQPQNVASGAQGFGVTTFKPKSWAAYSNGVFHITDRLNVTAGLRYSHDQKHVDFSSHNDATPPGQTTYVPSGSGTVFEVTVEDKRWDWKGGADYFITDDIMLYASAGSGYRLSSFVVRPWQAGQEGSIPGDALISYELGAKSEFFNRRLSLNVAAFQMDFTSRSAGYGGQEGQWNNTLTGLLPGNMTVVPGGPQDTPYADAFTTCRPYNAATDGPQNLNTTPDKGVGVSCLFRSYNYQVSGQIRGFEGELQAEPIDGLLINGSLGYSKWTSEGTSRQTVIPRWTASGGIQYEIPVEGLAGTVTPRLDWFYNSKIFYAADFPSYAQDARSVFNGRLSYHNEEHDFDVALGATNLFNKFYWVNQFPRATFGGSVNAGQPAAPREWYLSVKKHF